jgi:hypothetical protein
MPFEAAYGLAEPPVSRCQLTTKAENKPELLPHYKGRSRGGISFLNQRIS